MTVLNLTEQEWADAVRDAATLPAQVLPASVATVLERQGQQAA